MLRSVRGGLGAYPTDPYYDPNRPSWLPYWIDTPTESALKFGAYPGVTTVKDLPPIPQPIPPGVPAGGDTGAVTDPNAVSAVIEGSVAENKAQMQAYMDAVAAAEAKRQAESQGCPWYKHVDENYACVMGGTWFWLAAAAAAAVALYMRQR